MKIEERTETERPQVVIVESSRPRYYGRARYYSAPRKRSRGFSYMGSLWYRLGLVFKTIFCMLVLFMQFLGLVYVLGS